MTNPSNDWPSTRPFVAMVPMTVNCCAVDPDVLADGIHVLEQLFGDVGADDGDGPALAHVDLA